MTVSALFYLIAGFISLIAGADLLVRGASRVAFRAGLSPLVVGLTIVAYRTSAPELAASVAAATNGHAALALGNVVGSNIFNILLVLGISATAAPLAITRKLVRLDVPLMIAASVLLLLLAADGSIGILEGLLLLVLFGLYAYRRLRGARAEQEDCEAGTGKYRVSGKQKRGGLFLAAAMIIGGAGLLVLGGRWLVESATQVAAALGLSEAVIGLTVVSVGT